MRDQDIKKCREKSLKYYKRIKVTNLWSMPDDRLLNQQWYMYCDDTRIINWLKFSYFRLVVVVSSKIIRK